MGIGTAIVVIIGLVLVLSILGIGEEFFRDIASSAQEQREQQNDQASPDLQTTGNFAKNTGTRVCNIRVDFVGLVSKVDAYGFNVLGDDIFIYMGDHGILAETLGQLTQDKSIIKYQWFCIGDPVALTWNLQKNSLSALAFFDTFDGEIVRMKFEAFSMDTGKNMFDKTGGIQFQAKQTLPFGNTGTTTLDVTIFLEDVTEDNYNLRFWSDTSRVGVGGPTKDLGHKFSYDLCKPELTSC